MRIALILVMCAVGCAVGLAQEYQEDDRRSKLRSPRGPIVPIRPNSKNQVKPATSSTTPEPPPAEEGEFYDEQYDEEPVQEPKETTTTSTEAPKKGIRGGVVRPFRSNEDLIEALKRRRAQIHNEKAISTHAPAYSPTAAPEPTKGPSNSRQSKNLSNSRAKFSRGGAIEKSTSTTEEPGQEEPTQRSRLFAGRARRF